jgi:hypothetical protein
MAGMSRTTGGFSPLTLIVIVLVGLVSMAGLGVLSAYAPELKSGDDGGGHALSRASTGYGGLPRLLRSMDVPVILARGPLGDRGYESLLVLTPPPRSASQVDDVRHEGPVLIVLPKWRSATSPAHPGWVSTAGVLETEVSLSVLPEEMREGTVLSESEGVQTLRLERPDGVPFGAPVRLEAARRIAGPQWIPVVVDADGRGVLVFHRDSRTYVLADADLMATHGLKTLEGAQTALALLDIVRPEGAPVAFDLTLHGFQRTRNLSRLMLEPPLLGLTLALVGLAAFAGLQTAARFGPSRPSGRALALGKRALADNTAALVRMARREHHMATPYARLTRTAVARAIGVPRGLTDDELDAFLDRVGATAGAARPYSALVESARAARTPGDLMRVARDLYRWNQELTRARQ